MFCNMTKLEELDFSFNKLTNIDMDKETQPNRLCFIYRLSFQRNNLTSFVWDENVLQAKLLNLSNNRITKFFLYPNMAVASQTTFNLNQNSLQKLQIDSDILRADDNFTFQMKDMRDFDCDCLMPFYQKNISQLSFDFDFTQCAASSTLKTRFARNLLMEGAEHEVVCALSCSCVTRNLDDSVLVNCSNEVDHRAWGFADISFHPVSMFQEIVETMKFRKLFTDFSRTKEVALDFKNFRIDVSERHLEVLPVIPENFQFKLTEIFAPKNFIESVHIDSLGDHLKVLDLRSNKIKTLDSETIEKLIGAKRLHLGGNPWNCDCSMMNFFNLMYAEGVLVDYDDILCENYDNERLALVQTDQLCYNFWMIAAMVVTGFIAIGALVAIFYKFKSIEHENPQSN